MIELTQARRQPLLTQPWKAGVVGWVVVFGAVIVLLVGSIVTNQMPMTVAAPVLGAPAVVAIGFGVVQWLQARFHQVDPANWWHLTGIAAAAFTWLVWPIGPSIFGTVRGPAGICSMLYTASPGCVARAANAVHGSHLVWWLTGAVIAASALLARRSRIAAWAAIPVSMAGCMLASHFLEMLAVYYHYNGA